MWVRVKGTMKLGVPWTLDELPGRNIIYLKASSQTCDVRDLTCCTVSRLRRAKVFL